MGETLLLITITTLVVLTVRRSKPAVLDNPVTMHRPGKYHITLAPQLNRAQALVEAVAKQLSGCLAAGAEGVPLYFYVHDEKIFSTGEKFYLLAVSAYAGMSYVQAIKPVPAETAAQHLATIRTFAATVLAAHPVTQPTVSDSVLLEAVQHAAQNMHIRVERLPAEVSEHV